MIWARFRGYLESPAGGGRRALVFSLKVAVFTAVAVALIHLFAEARQTPLEFILHLALVTASYTLCLTLAWLLLDALLGKSLPRLRHSVVFLWAASALGFLVGMHLLDAVVALSGTGFRSMLSHGTEGWLPRLLPVWLVVTALLIESERTRSVGAQLARLREERESLPDGSDPPREEGAERVTLVCGDDRHVLRSDSIRYIEAAENYCTYHLGGDQVRPSILLRTTLKSALAELPDRLFVQIHRSFVTNIGCVESISRKGRGYVAVLRGDRKSLPVARSRLDEAIRRWQEYVKGANDSC